MGLSASPRGFNSGVLARFTLAFRYMTLFAKNSAHDACPARGGAHVDTFELQYEKKEFTSGSHEMK